MPSSPQRLLQRFISVSNPDAAGNWRAFCPMCEDPNTSQSPSAAFNFDSNKWKCFSCSSGGTVKTLINNLRSQRNGHVNGVSKTIKIKSKKIDMGKASGAEDSKPKKKPLPTDSEVRHWQERLFSSPKQLEYVTDMRGLSKETIKQYEIGWDGFRFTIPIRNLTGGLVNVRRYDPRKKDKDKMISWGEGYGKARIYGLEVLNDENIREVILTEGEWDRLIAIQQGIPAVTHTAGALTFDVSWGPLFKDKVVFICYDADQTGRKGAMKAARVIAPHAEAVYIMELDIDIKGGDITDFFIKQGRSIEEFNGVMEYARQKPFGVKRERPPAPNTGIKVSLEESQSTEYGDKPVEMLVSISGKQSPPYIAPRKIRAVCDQSKGQICSICPMAERHGEMVHVLQPDDPVILEFADVNSKIKNATLKDIIGAKCSDHVDFNVEDNWTVEQLVVTNSVEHRTEEQQTPMTRPVLNVGSYKTPINITARLVGRQVPSPKDQRGLLQSWMLEQTQTSLDKFQITPEVYESLRAFRPRKGQTALDRCVDIARDLAHNVTHIYGRPELHIAYDLVWHSILDFDFLGQRIGKGWLEGLVVGDTRTGKSEAAQNLARHYGAGVVKSCEGMTFAGLVGGVQQMAGRHWMVTWGTIPLNDRRLVVLDEVSGLQDKDVIENMSAIRSSGKAQLTKIATDEASARTRLIWISNPPDGRALREINGGGMEVVAQLVRNNEDIARFDFAMAAASSDVDADLINSTSQHEEVHHRFTDDICSTLVIWAWSRKADQVYWLDGAESAVIEAAKDIGNRYVPDPPLVQIENVRMKVARIAVALAARTFSTDSTGELVVVKPAHVDGAVKFLDMLYGKESFGYLRHSRRAMNARREAEQNKQETREFLEEHHDDIRHTLLSVGNNLFKTRDFEEIGAMDRVEAQVAVRQLLEWKMIRRLSKGMMRMEPALIELLRDFEDKDND